MHKLKERALLKIYSDHLKMTNYGQKVIHYLTAEAFIIREIFVRQLKIFHKRVNKGVKDYNIYLFTGNPTSFIFLAHIILKIRMCKN